MTYTSKTQLVEALRNQISTRDNVAIKALITVYGYQTESERNCKDVHVLNGIGFMGKDAEFASSLVEFYNKNNFFSSKQISLVKKIMTKYAGQLINQSISKGLIKKEGNIYIW